MISNVFTYAIKQGFVKDNPCRNVTLPPVEKKKLEMYTQSEAQQMLDLFAKEKIENLKYVVFYSLALKLGLRRGEILGLEWKDIDFDSQLISIQRDSLYTKELGTYTGSCKTEASVRILPADESVFALLTVYKMYQDKCNADFGEQYHDIDRLFTKANGEPMNVSSPNDYMIEFCKRTGMRKVSNHSFRHLNASTLISKGFDIKTVQDFLGHKQAETTLNIYAHAFVEQKARLAHAMKDGFNMNVSTWEEKIQKDA